MRHVISTFAVASAISPNLAIAQDSSAAIAAEEAAQAIAEAATDAAEATVVEIKPRYPQDPYPSSRGFIRAADYPIDSWRNGEEGQVRYSVEVDVEGNPTSCEVIETSGFPSLDAATCPAVMQRALFSPALSGPDQPIAGTYEGRHNWRIREPEMPQMTAVFRYFHGADGQTSDCEFLKMENLPEKVRKEIERDMDRGRLCEGSGFGRSRGIPYRDENGNPISKVVTVTFDVQLEDPE